MGAASAAGAIAGMDGASAAGGDAAPHPVEKRTAARLTAIVTVKRQARDRLGMAVLSRYTRLG